MTTQDDHLDTGPNPNSGEDERLAQMLEQWEAEIKLGHNPELTILANGDEALAAQLKPLVSVLQCLQSSGFHQVAALAEREKQLLDPGPSGPLSPDPDQSSNHSETNNFEIAIPGYQILGQLGKGGMGVVYEARQISLNRIVAIKVLPQATIDPRVASRFAREAETVASLQHSQIVPIYESGQTQGLHWFAMQKIDGQALSKVIADHSRGLPWQRVVEIGIQVCDALSYAHSCGVVHRDVKPGNLLQDSEGMIWLADFGLAYRMFDATLTLSQAILGTPRYMSPEQIQSVRFPSIYETSNQSTVTLRPVQKPKQSKYQFNDHSGEVDHHTDIYSLGATLFELLTGQPVFDQTSPIELLSAIQFDEPPDPTNLSPECPKSLAIVLQKCLEKSPRDRYEMVADLQEDLTAVRDDRPISVPGLSAWTLLKRRVARHSNRIWIATVGALVALGALLGAVSLYRNYSERQMAQWKLTSSGGPFLVSLAKIGEQSGPQRQVESVALPMHQTQKTRAGAYDVQLAQPGRFSQPATVYLSSGQSNSMHYQDGHPSPTEIDVEGKLFTEVRSQNDSSHRTLVTIDRNQITAYGPDSKLLFQVPVAFASKPTEDNANKQNATGPTDASPERRTRAIDFGFDRGDLWEQYWAIQPNLAKPARVLSPCTDVSGDGQMDYIFSARWEPVIAALDQQGALLWQVRLPVEVSDEAQPTRQRKPVELCAVNQMRLSDDITGDGIAEIVVVTQRELDLAKKPFVFSQLSVVDGNTGQVVWTKSIAPIDTHQVSRWPPSGLLPRPTDLQGWAQGSSFSAITQRRPIRRIPSDETFFGILDEDFHNFPSKMLTTLPPIHFVDWDSRSHIAVWQPQSGLTLVDLGNGSQSGLVDLSGIKVQSVSLIPDKNVTGKLSPLNLGEAETVREVRLGKDRGKGLLFVVQNTPAKQQKTVFRDDDLLLYHIDQQSVTWHDRLPMLYSHTLVTAEQSDFPLIADLDHDGTDEIYLSLAHDLSKSLPYQSVHARDAMTGRQLWPGPTRMSCYESVPERACVVPDINQDAVDELAVVTLCDFGGLSNRQSLGTIQPFATPQCLSLMVDILCGKTGQRLKLFSHPVAEINPYSRNASYEISGCRTLGSRQLEVSTVWWNSPHEKLLNDRSKSFNSASVRFDLQTESLPQVAPGLTMLTRHPITEGGFHLRRPVTEREQTCKVVWQPAAAPSRLTRNRQLLGTWISDKGQPCALVKARDQVKVEAIDLESKEIIWEQTLSSPRASAGFVQPGQEALAYFESPTSSQSDWLNWIDAETGKQRTGLSKSLVLERVLATAACVDASGDIFVVGLVGDNGVRSAAPARKPKICLWRVNLPSGQVRWQKELGTTRSQGYGPNFEFGGYWYYDPTIVVLDCDRDGKDDCIVTSRPNNNLVKGITALSGDDGNELWKRMHQSQQNSMGEPWNELWLDSLADSTGTEYLVIMEPEAPGKDDNGVRLLLIDSKTGDQCSHQVFRNARFNQTSKLNMRDRRSITANADAPPTKSVLSLAIPEEASDKARALNFVEIRVDGENLVQTTSSVQTDSRPWQITAAKTVQLSNADLRRLLCGKDSLSCYDQSGQLLWQHKYLEKSTSQLVELMATDDPRYWLLSCDQTRLSRSLYDITDGRLIW
ncbi:MAG TPA: hypothetical protein DCF63_10850, partial [Planctomycetaceae bacterium]|nr:hypothetical protein [Planctomycetaceae bacterium]